MPRSPVIHAVQGGKGAALKNKFVLIYSRPRSRIRPDGDDVLVGGGGIYNGATAES